MAGAAFPTVRRGFDPAEVRDFLRMVSAELARLQEREAELERALIDLEQRPTVMSDGLDDEQLAEALGAETAAIIQAARDAAMKIRARGEETANRLVRDATDEALRIREEVELEAARRRQDAAADAEAEIELAKQQGRDMVNEARAYRERVLADVARRRELAREQLEDLVHGRDRLIQAFERARIATDDVLRDLVDVGDQPGAYVNLTNTTGPVPILLPVENGPADSDDDDEPEIIEFPTRVENPAAARVDVTAPETIDVADEVETDAGVDVADESVPDDHSPVETISETTLEVSVIDTPIADGRQDHPAMTGPIGHDGPIAHDEPKSNVVPLFGKSEPVPPANPVTRPRSGSADDIFAKLRKAGAEVVAQQASEAAQKNRPTITDSPKTSVVDLDAPLDEIDDSPFGVRDEILVPLILTMGRKLKRTLADEQNQVLDTLRGKTAVKTLDAIVGTKSQHSRRYCDGVSASVKSAAVAGARSMHASGKLPSDRALNDMVANQMAAIDEYITDNIVGPLRERLSRCISQAEGNNVELSSLVRVVYREWKNQYIDEHVDDIAHTAYGRGALSALVPGGMVCWQFDPAGPACPDAEDNSLAGPTAAGEPFPTGHTHAPAHRGCRCVLVPADN